MPMLPVPIYRPLGGSQLKAFEHMVDALKFLDISGEAETATRLAQAIEILVHAPLCDDVSKETGLIYADRLDSYMASVDRGRSALPLAAPA